MHCLDRRDQRDLRLDHPDKRRDLARMVHADFEHAVPRGFRHPRERQRHAEMIVVRRRRRMRRALHGEDRVERFLGASLADGARHRRDPRGRAGARRPAKRDQRVKHIGHGNERPLAPRRRAPQQPPP